MPKSYVYFASYVHAVGSGRLELALPEVIERIDQVTEIEAAIKRDVSWITQVCVMNFFLLRVEGNDEE